MDEEASDELNVRTMTREIARLKQTRTAYLTRLWLSLRPPPTLRFLVAGHEDDVNITTPAKLSGPWGKKKIVAAAVGKSHTILVDEDGKAYGAGRNSEGQCGINTITEGNVTAFKPCKVGKDSKDCKFVKVSCGENFTVAIDEQGMMYTCGNSEYGTLGNGSTGERLVKANKISFNPSAKFVRRDQFVKRDLNFKENEVRIYGERERGGKKTRSCISFLMLYEHISHH